MPKSYIEKILNSRVYDVAIETPLEKALSLSERLDNTVLLKREDLQPVHSFKLRGAYNKLSQLSPEIAKKGVIASSAGNHAQGIALGAQKLGIKALIVMPRTTPEIKVASVKALGAKIILHGDAYDDAYEHAIHLSEEKDMEFIHPYDDKLVIAGQGTIAMEILRQHSGPIHAVFIPIGGGGLVAGMAAYIKELRPEIKIIGVEPEDAPSMYCALEEGRRVILDQVGIFADGVAVRQVGKEPFRIARKCVDEVILVSTDEICAAIMDIFDDTRSITEPAGALALAGVKRYVEREKIKKETLVAIDSGANVNFDRLRHISERAEVGEAREALIAVTIPERPGSFKEFCRHLGRRGITEFNYRYSDADEAHVFAGVKLGDGQAERNRLIKELREGGYSVIDMTDNEMAKVHVRYMVGGHARAEHEVVYRFEFPERPGALLQFLTRMGQHWNISMFHYRNHGAAYGRVLVGMQVPQKELPRLQDFLDDLGYSYWNETDNLAYALFLN